LYHFLINSPVAHIERINAKAFSRTFGDINELFKFFKQMKSNRAYTLIFKYSFFGISIMSISFGILGYLIPNMVKINGQRGQLDETELLIFLIIGLISLVIFFAIKHKFVLVDLAGNKITIIKNHERIEAKWTDVKFVKKIPSIKPPLYRIKLKNIDKTYLFTTQPNFKIIRIVGTIFDDSEMGNRISKMKRELEI